MFTGVTASSVAFAESDGYDKDMRHVLDRYCEMSAEDKKAFVAEHDKAAEHVAKMNEYCELDEVQRDAYIEEHKDDYRMNYDKDMRHMLDRYCEMSAEDKKAFVAEHDKAAEHVAKMNEYCSLDEDARKDFIKDHMNDKMRDNMSDKRPHMDYDRLCELSETDRAAKITDSAKLDRISEWCNMTPEERDDYKRDHPDKMRDNMSDKRPHMDYDRLCELSETERALEITDVAKLEKISKWCDMTPQERDDYKRDYPDKKHDFDRMSDMAKDRMSDVAKNKLYDKAMKFSDESKRLKAMIMEKHDISDERMDEIKMKYREKYGDLTDEKKSVLKMTFKDHMKTIKVNMSDERKTAIHDRVAEMKAFKADLRDRASSMTDEEKQELRAEFIEKAKDMQLAWISPRHQMHAGIDAAEVQCREGFSHVLKASNGMAMCLKADTALKMITRGIAVPAN